MDEPLYSGRQTLHLVLHGQLDIAQSGTIRAALPARVSAAVVIVDCTKTTYIDSFVLGMLVEFRRKFLLGGGQAADFVITLPESGPVRRVFEVSGVTRYFAIRTGECSAAGATLSPEDQIIT
jgi:anti-anti-sigma factor